MSDDRVTLGELRERLDRFVRERDWGTYHNLKDLSMALSIEASELLERFLWREAPAVDRLSAEERQAIADELADVMIYGLHLSNALGLDLSETILAKVEKNAAKYPMERFKGRAR